MYTWLPPHRRTEQPIEDDHDTLDRAVYLGLVLASAIALIFGAIWLSVTGGW